VIGNLFRAGGAALRHRLSGRRSPLFLSYAATWRCTNHCAYCDLPPAGREMTFEEFRPLLDAFREMGLVRLGLTGGEPLLHPDIGRILGRCRRIGVATVVSTNGALVKERIVELAELDLASVSIDGARDVQDLLRGSGSFAACEEAVDLLVRKGVGVVLSAVLHSRNVGRVDDLLEMARRKRVATVWQPYFRSMRPPEEDDPLLPDPARFRAAVERVIAAKLRSPWLVASSLPYLRFVRDHYPTWDPAGCLAGKLFFALSPEGVLHPCYPMTGRSMGVRLTAGDVRAAVEGFAEAGCTTPCYCNGHLENNFLFRLNPLSILDVLATAAVLVVRRKRG
jgi:MoaA/NifB/PqqE/SkfB family radical SAM enzyme